MAPKTDKDAYFGLTQSQAKLILVASLFADDVKPDWNRFAEKAGLTVSSVRSMYPKAIRHWREMHAPATTSTEDTVTATGDEKASKEMPKQRKPRGPGQKRKRGGDEPAAQAELVDPSTEALEGNTTLANDNQAPKPKKSRGPGRKRTQVEEAPPAETEKLVYEPETEPAPAIEQADNEPEGEPEIQAEDESTESTMNKQVRDNNTVSGYDADDDLA